MDENTAETLDGALLRRYLLGEATEDEEARVERHLLTAAAGLEDLEMAEDDLIEACARGDLPEAERKRVLAGLAASSAGRARLALARDLAYVADGEPGTLVNLRAPAPRPPRRPWSGWRLQIAALAAALVLAVATGGVWRAMHPGRSDLSPAVFELSMAAERGSARMPELEVPSGSRRVELRLALDEHETYRAYRAVLRDAAGRTVASARGLALQRTPTGPEIVLDLPAADLPPGRYEVAVQGERARGPIEDVAWKEFAVIR
jgi:hypothetical protein